MGIYLPETTIEKYNEEVGSVLRSGNLAEGDQRKQVESLVGHRFDQEVYVTLLNSNGSGLFSALMYYKSMGHDRVLIQSNTMYGVGTVVETAGMKLEVLPSNKNTMILDSDALEKHLKRSNDKKTIVLVSHIGGSIDDSIKLIGQVCKQYNVPMIEDAAHSLGAKYQIVGDVLVYSMYATKVAPAGEGGILVTMDKGISEFVNRFIIYDRLHMEYRQGINLRVSEIHACLMKHVILGLDHIIEDRQSKLKKYKSICDEKGIKYLATDYENHNAYKFIITDKNVIDKVGLPQKNKQGITPEYKTGQILTGTVFGYSLDNDVQPPIPHICLNTNYMLSDEIIENSIKFLENI